MTSNSNNPWWKVDLAGEAKVFEVAIKSPTTWNPAVINPFDIRVGNDDSNGGINNLICVSSASLATGQMAKFECPDGMQGQFVSVHLNGVKMLILCEVQVYGMMLP